MGPEYEAWAEAWADAVRQSPRSVGLVTLATTEILALSPGAGELLGLTAEEAVGVKASSLTDHPDRVELAVEAVAAGALDAVQARRRLRRADGSAVEVMSCSSAIRSDAGPDLALWVVDPVPPPALGEGLPLAPGAVPRALGHPPHIVGTIDHTWRVERVSADVADLGLCSRDVVGTSIFDLVDPSDVPALLLAFARATSEGDVTLELRLTCDAPDWRRARVVVARLAQGQRPRFGFALTPAGEPDVSPDATRVAELERHLRRIGIEVQAARVLHALEGWPAIEDLPALGELTARQWEVLTRIASGQRVATIAAEMYLCRSTVRNHLSAIFRKAGVHSQEELLMLLRGRTERAV